MKVWALTDGRPGNDNQTLSIAEQFPSYEIKQIDFGKSANLPNFLLKDSKIGFKINNEGDWPDIVISTGRKLARVASYIKKKSGCKAYQIMSPQIPLQNFDLIFSPEHDDLKGDNVVKISGASNRIDEKYLSENRQYWQMKLPISEEGTAAVLLGDINKQEAKELVELLNQKKYTILATSSRRTPPGIDLVFKKYIKVKHHFYNFQSKKEQNPYGGMLALADIIVTTSDSIGMISEACTTGKPVYIFESSGKSKMIKFRYNLYEKDYAKPLTNEPFTAWHYPPLNTRDFIVEKIKQDIES